MWQFPEKSIEEYSNGTDGLKPQEIWAHWLKFISFTRKGLHAPHNGRNLLYIRQTSDAF